MLQGEPLQDRAYRKIHVAGVVSKKGVNQDVVDNRAVEIRDRYILIKKNETTNMPLLSKLIHFTTKLLRIGQPRIKEFFLIGYLGNGARQLKEFRHFPGRLVDLPRNAATAMLRIFPDFTVESRARLGGKFAFVLFERLAHIDVVSLVPGRYIAEVTVPLSQYWLLTDDAQRSYQETLAIRLQRVGWRHRFRHWESFIINPHFANLQP